MAQLVTINVAQLVTIKMAKRSPVSNFTAYIYICICAEDLIWWANFRLQDIKIQEAEGEKKLRQKKADRRKKKKLGNMKPPPSWCFSFSWPILAIKWGKVEIFDQKIAYQLKSSTYIYIECRS